MSKKGKSLGLKSKIILPILLAIILGVALILIFILNNYQTTTTTLSDDLMFEMGEHYGYYIESNINDKLSILKSLESIMEQSGKDGIMNREQLLDFLENVLTDNDSLYSIFTCWEPNAFDGKDNEYAGTFLHDETGRFIPYITRDGKRALSRYNEQGYGDYYLMPKRTGKTCIIEPYMCNVTAEKSVYMASVVQPLNINGNFVGVIGIDILIDPIADLLKEVKLFDNGYIYLISSEGQIISHPNKNLIKDCMFDHLSIENSDIIKNSLESSKSKQFNTVSLSNNENIITNMVPIPIGETGDNWGIGVSVPISEIEEPINSGIRLGVGAGLFVCIAAIIILLYIIGRITKKVHNINEKLSQSSSYVSTASMQLASTSQELSDGSNEQAASIEESSASMEETASMVKQNAENILTASNLSEKAKEAAQRGANVMNKMVIGMEELKSSSTQISKIIKVINDIAFQTNILALNAAVEAARAGDAGQGFAVVAEEVRNLAQKSAAAAKDTSEIIEKNIELSDNGVNISEEVRKSLNEITAEIERVNSLISEVSASSDEQTQGVEQVTDAMANIDQVVQKNAAAAEESAAAAEELQAQSNELETVVKELNQLIKGTSTVKKSKSKKKNIKENNCEKKQIDTKSEKIGTEKIKKISKEEHNASPEEIIPLETDNEF